MKTAFVYLFGALLLTAILSALALDLAVQEPLPREVEGRLQSMLASR
jgi:hypothetical protein